MRNVYCEEDELLVGQLISRLPPQVKPADFIEAADIEIDSKLGFVYKTPFVLGELPEHQAKLIKDIARKLASGRIILAASSAVEGSTIHAYGASLVSDAMVSLMAVANGEVRISAPTVDFDGKERPETVDPEDSDPYAFVPTGSTRDSQGGVVAFENNFMQDPAYPYPTRYVNPYRPNDG